MPIFDYDFNKRDRELILTQDSAVNTLNNPGTYIRLTIYPLEAITNIVSLPDITRGISGKAVFFSTLSNTNFSINVTPFKIGDNSLEEKIIGPPINDVVFNDFKIYENSNGNIYIKPNEIFNDFQLPQGDYRIQIDFLNQVNSIQNFQIPYWFEEFNLTQIEDGPEILNTADATAWNSAGRLDIAAMVTDIVTGQIPEPPKFSETQGDVGPDSETLNNLPSLRPLTDFIATNKFYEFIVKQVSTSRKEVRLKLLNENILNDSNIITNLTDAFNNFEPELIIDDDENSLTFGQEIPNPNYRYQFKHVLSIGNGEHIPIMNYMFDKITDGTDNQSIILKLYNQLPGNIRNLSRVTIEEEILTTQLQDIFYFSDVPDVNFGDGLLPDSQENWINPDNNDIGFQSLDELSISASIGEIEADYLISSSEYGYPNLNTDFNEFSNHTFFGSAKKKLENFKTKVETIQGHYSEISSSLNVSSSFDGDAVFIIEKRKNLFNKIKQEFNTFTPYEKFLYFDGQTESTASAPSLVNYADTFPVSDEGVELGPTDGFNQMYKFSSENIAAGGLEETDLFTNKYFVQNKPFFNYDDSIYLSFLMKGNSGSSITWDNNNLDMNTNGLGLRLPEDAKFQDNILNPNITGSEYQRYVFETSHSYFIPNTSNNDMADLNHDDFKAGSTKIHILSGSTKTGSYKIKDSTNQYPTTVVSQSGVPFFGSVMPSGELFKIYYKNTLSSSLQGYWNVDSQTSGSLLVDSMLGDFSGNGNTGSKAGAPTIGNGVEVHGRQYGKSMLFLSASSPGQDDEVFFKSDDYNFSISGSFSLSIWVKRFSPTTGSADGQNNAGDRNTQSVFGRGSFSDSYGIDYSQQNNRYMARIRTNNAGSASIAQETSNQADDGLGWNHIVMTFESGSSTGLKLYKNGVLANSATTDISTINATGQEPGMDFITSSLGGDERLKLAGNDVIGGNGIGFNGFLQYPRVYDRTISPAEVKQLYLYPGGVTETKITDVKVSLNNPTDVLPFDNIYKTTSTLFTDWYNNALSEAETFDTNNIHSLENNLPIYIKESSEYNDFKDFLNLQGEQYDIVRNHIDSMGTIHKRGYDKTNSPPENTLPMLLANMGWEVINPFSGSLEDSLGQYLTGVTSIDDIKNNTWRKTLNNLLYIYKTKGTQNSVRAMLNVYGYPPDVLKLQEFGGVVGNQIGQDTNVINDEPPTFTTLTTGAPPINDTNLGKPLSSFSVQRQNLYRYMFGNVPSRTLELDWWMDDANANTFEFVYKHRDSSNQQTILKSSGSGTETLWDLRLIPSSDRASSSFEFRLNNSETGSLAIATNAVSMSTQFFSIQDGQLLNLMVQRMTQSIAGNLTNEYRLHASLQNNNGIGPYQYVTMSISGGVSQDSNHFANLNWFSSGSRHQDSSSNLYVGETISGSLSQIKAWTTPLSISKFRHHTINKVSTIGNTLRSHEKELIYHFKLGENYNSSSVSSSTQNFKIVDSAPKCTLKTNYSFDKSARHFASSSVYGFDTIDIIKFNVQDNTTKESDNNVLIDIQPEYFGDLSSNKDSVKSLINPKGEKPKLKISNKLELTNSPQDIINTEILTKLDGFNFEKLYGNPINFYSQSYLNFDAFRQEFFECHPIQVNVNDFIRGQENIFNQSLTEAIKSVVPGGSTFSDKNSGASVLIKPTILEKPKYKNKEHSVEIVNPFSSSVNTLPVSLFNIENSKDGLYDINVSSSANLEDTKTGLISLDVSRNFTFEDTKNGTINVKPELPSVNFEREKSGSFDFGVTLNKSFENIHSNYGKGTNNLHFINFASDTGSNNDFNTLHLDSRFLFISIGDEEIYSGSQDKYFGSFKHTDFTNHKRLQNRTILSDGVNSSITYESFVNGNPGAITGRMMGKTRYFSSSADGTETFFPANHVSKFSQPFKERMNEGTQNTDPGFLNVRYEDYSTASFYRVKVTGGENSIRVKSGGNPSIDSDDRIIY